MQIQAVGLQVVKVMLQKGTGAESDPYLVFYFGELVEDLLVILQNILEVRMFLQFNNDNNNLCSYYFTATYFLFICISFI